jgi:hypothetical protein
MPLVTAVPSYLTFKQSCLSFVGPETIYQVLESLQQVDMSTAYPACISNIFKRIEVDLNQWSRGRGAKPPSSHTPALLLTSPTLCTAGSSLNAAITSCMKLGTARRAPATCRYTLQSDHIKSASLASLFTQMFSCLHGRTEAVT